MPAHERILRRRTYQTLHELLHTRRLATDEMAALQSGKLRSLLIHSRERVPWYRDAMRALGCDPRVDDPWQVLSALPPVSRRDVQANLDRFVAEGSGSLVSGRTSGSSGEPLSYFLDARRIAADKAARFRAQIDWGVRIGDRKAWLWGQPQQAGLTDRLKVLRDRLANERILNAYDMSPARMREYVRLLRSWRPRSVTCYPSAGWRLARFVQDEGLDLRGAGIGVWFTTGEVLQDHQRYAIEQASGGRVANEYGLREAGFVAHECPDGTMHVTAESVYLETVRADGSPSGDQLGEILVTNLDNFGMPLLRYKTRDFGRVGKARCACGWPTQTLTDLAGRQTDFLIASDRTPVVGFALSRRFWEVPGVAQFRIIQESLSNTRVQVVASDGFDDATRRHIDRMVREVLGLAVTVAIERVDAIPAAPSGKTAYIQSRIAQEFM